MGLITRCVRIFKADIHGVMDQLEDKGLLLKQYLRDMEEALERKEARLKKMNLSRNQALRECEKYNHDIEKLEQDLEVAIKRNKDEIARLLIKKIKPLTRLRDDIESHIGSLDQEIAQFDECVNQQRVQYEQLKHRATEYFRHAEQKEWEKTFSAFIPGRNAQELTEEELELELIQRKEALGANKGGNNQ
ncbi:MAG: PspA/IM30 family protein [Desulfobacterales bacterium]|nr:MAG: PspA/IM30 family protein [Desulfobacterales bacterium]